MDSNFSKPVKEIIAYSREEALRLGNDFIGTEHLLLGLIREGEGIAVRVLQSMQVDLFDLRKELEMAIKDKSNKPLSNINSLPLTKQAEKIIRITVLEAKALKSDTVETEHLMLSLLKNKENVATQILHEYDVDYEGFKAMLRPFYDNIPFKSLVALLLGTEDTELAIIDSICSIVENIVYWETEETYWAPQTHIPTIPFHSFEAAKQFIHQNQLQLFDTKTLELLLDQVLRKKRIIQVEELSRLRNK